MHEMIFIFLDVSFAFRCNYSVTVKHTHETSHHPFSPSVIDLKMVKITCMIFYIYIF